MDKDNMGKLFSEKPDKKPKDIIGLGSRFLQHVGNKMGRPEYIQYNMKVTIK
jgi:CRISPR/Cas system-associated protein Cas10 (large subunit of type III CRISPR-Cas system)